LGAFLSIAMSIRARTVTTDGDWRSNAADAVLRISIGFISSVVLYIVLAGGVLPSIKVGGLDLTATNQTLSWAAACLAGFCAGFVERLVPDLLEKQAPASQAQGSKV
jgi:zinc transporter ZupT